MITKELKYGLHATVKEGSVIQLPSGRMEQLKLDHSEPCPGWPGAQFRLPCPIGRMIAVNVTITGRTIQRRGGADWVRVKLEWVGDCEPSTFSKGWLLV